MEQRNVRRVKRRITCEFFYKDDAYKGIILDLDRAGLFIRTNAAIPPGVEIDIHMAASTGAPAMTLRAQVARRRSVPANLSSIIARGLGVRILEAPREYSLLVDAGVLGSPIERESSSAPPPRRSNHDSAATHSKPPAATRPNSTSPAQPEPEPNPSTPDRTERVTARPTPPRRSGKTSGPTDRSSTETPSPMPSPTAALVGGDELNEIAGILVAFGVDVVHAEPGDSRLADLSGTRLIVVSARIVLAHAIPIGGSATVSVVVCEEVSNTIRTMLGNRGFQYLVHQHVHIEALRLLIRYALFDRPDRRAQQRLPFGYEVSWRVGWRRKRGRLLEISPDGCRLFSANPLPLNTRIQIKIPGEVAGGRPLKLRGAVIRCLPHQSIDCPGRVAVGVAFDDLSPKLRKELNRVCDLWSDGPPALPFDSAEFELTRSGEKNEVSVTDEDSELSGLQSQVAAVPVVEVHALEQTIVEKAIDEGPVAEEAIDEEPLHEASSNEDCRDKASVVDEGTSASTRRRRNPRGRFDREIVEVDAERHVVRALLGRDLSIGGIRVDPQLGLEPGDKLQLAIFDPTRREPLILCAVVARDDGGFGMGLHFTDLSSESQARLTEMIAALPAVESLGPPSSSTLVPAGILSNERRYLSS